MPDIKSEVKKKKKENNKEGRGSSNANRPKSS